MRMQSEADLADECAKLVGAKRCRIDRCGCLSTASGLAAAKERQLEAQSEYSGNITSPYRGTRYKGAMVENDRKCEKEKRNDKRLCSQ